MNNKQEFDHREEFMVHAYVDGELIENDRKEFEDRLRQDEELQDSVSAYKAQNNALHREFDEVLDEEISQRLLEAVRVPKTRRSGRQIWKTLAMAASILVSATVGWFANDWSGDTVSSAAGRTLAEQAVLAHFMYSVSTRSAGPIKEDQKASLIQRVSHELGSTVQPPNLQKAGYRLAGGRLLPVDRNDKAAQFMYEGQNNRLLTLYVRSGVEGGDETTASRYIEEAAVGVFYWMHGGLGYGLAGHMQRSELTQLARFIQARKKHQ